MPPFIWDRLQIAVEEESVEGTAENLVAADALLAKNVAFDPDVEMHDRAAASSSLSPFAKVPGSRQAKLSYDVDLRGSGTAGVAPEYGKPLKGCGMSETIVADTSVTYGFASSSVPSLTQGWYVDGRKYLFAGSRGNWKLKLKAGAPGVIRFDFLGTALEITDAALLSGVSYQATEPPPFLSASFALDSYAGIIENLELGSNNNLGLRSSANAAQGYVSAIIGGRMPTVTMDPEDVLASAKDWWSILNAGTLMALTAQVGATAGNICTLAGPKLQLVKMKPGSRNGFAIQQMELEPKRNSGDDELTLAFT